MSTEPRIEARAVPQQPEKRGPWEVVSDTFDILLERVEAVEAIRAAPGPKGDPGAPGKPGRDGQDGRAITGTLIDADGRLVVTYSDGSAVPVGPVVGQPGKPGEPGRPGAPGVGIKSFALAEDGRLHVTLTDGQTHDLGAVRGRDGEPGKPGEPGKAGDPGQPGAAGRSVVEALVNSDGRLVLTFSDGEAKDAGRVAGAKGDPGEPGKPGEPGRAGTDGRSIVSANIDPEGRLALTYSDGTQQIVGRVVGEPGKPGEPGANGRDGKDAEPAEPGAPGVGVAGVEVDAEGNLVVALTDGRTVTAGRVRGDPGAPGRPGKDGLDGRAGKPGKRGEPGRPGRDAEPVFEGSHIDASAAPMPAGLTPDRLRNVQVREIVIDGVTCRVLVL